MIDMLLVSWRTHIHGLCVFV